MISDVTTIGKRFYESLTPREAALVLRLAEGGSNKEIGAELHINVQVVKNYLRAIYNKSGVDDRQQLLLFLFRHRVVPCPCGRG